MRRLSTLLLVLFSFAVPAFARVISYAPYTNRVATPGYHLRTTPHFLLLESEDGAGGFHDRQLVLYSLSGDEPRVIYPQNGGSAVISVAALHERQFILHAPPEPPMVLVTVVGSNNVPMTLFSGDGGATWKEVEALRGKFLRHDPAGLDTGGPYVRGLGGPIRTGNDSWPFVVSTFSHGVWAVDGNGGAKPLVADANAVVVGQDLDGSRYLVRTIDTSAGYTLTRLSVVAIDGTSTTIAANLYHGAQYAGWVARDGSAYLVVTRPEGRFLFRWRNQQLEFLQGPYGAQPPQLSSAPTGVSRPAHEFIAVPTADFNGAWTAQRRPGQPTTLSRYTPTRGVEKMWADPAGPEIEALIAGVSGESVLVQVHRDRSEVLQRPFIDPALAVWRVGEPMPRHYDELYLNEEADKGFVHVDVDNMRAGAPFVFNSGTVQLLNEGPISPPIGGGGDVVQEWGVVQASLKQRLVLPGVARLPGAFNSNWLTDVTIFNPDSEPQNVEIHYAGLGEVLQEAVAERKTTVTLEPREIRFIPDALFALFGITNGGGALHFVPATGINVTARTYSRTASGGTFGFGMQAIDFYNAAGPRFPMTFSGAFPGEHFRTNILLTDTSGRGAEARLSAFGVSGPLGTNDSVIATPAGGTMQVNGIGGTIGLFGRDAGGLKVQPTRGTAIATVVAIDNRTNDPTYFPPDLPASAAIVRSIPVIGHVDGANNSRFRSDVYLFNPTTETRTVILEAKAWDSAARSQRQFTLLPSEARVVPDALQTLFQMTGLARLRYWTNDTGDGVRVTSRTYTVDAGGATYGSLIPPLNNFQLAVSGDALEILGVTGGNFRTNIGLVELSPLNTSGTTSVRVRIFDERVRQLDAFTVSVPRTGGMQINDVFSARGIATPAAALIVVEVLDQGLIGAYATLTDNITNDTTYLGAHLGAKPE